MFGTKYRYYVRSVLFGYAFFIFRARIAWQGGRTLRKIFYMYPSSAILFLVPLTPLGWLEL